MTIDMAIGFVEATIAKRVANGSKPTTITRAHGIVRIQFAVDLPWATTNEDEYTEEQFCQLVEDAIDYATDYDEADFDEALTRVGLPLGDDA